MYSSGVGNHMGTCSVSQAEKIGVLAPKINDVGDSRDLQDFEVENNGTPTVDYCAADKTALSLTLRTAKIRSPEIRIRIGYAGGPESCIA